MNRKVLFLDAVHPILEERLVVLKYVCEHDYFSSKKEIEAKIATYFGVVIRSRITIDKTFLDSATNLKFIARSGSGLENIDVAYAQQKGIKVFNSPEGNRDAVGEHTIGMLLFLFNQLKKGDAEVRKGIWDREGNRGLEISEKTIGIIGYGNMGSAFAKKLSGFDCKIIAYDKYKVSIHQLTNEDSNWVDEVSLEELKEKADIISIHLPLTEETHHYVDAKFISSCKKPFYLINTARGNHVKVPDLVEALKSGKILGACLDVLEYETKSFETINSKDLPDAFNFLAQSDKVVLSPHVAGWTKESYLKLSSYLADKIEQNFSLGEGR
ncbi:MAG: hydroxyacid dehydrogenase [Bacteroidetes bacterium RIFCSPLOWO2_12_FULL_31_6]|nr:MAG: hydroxyacid dehydrogenase [Bacteroidetes bacterium RIFCSPLOWO2_12_FULL_31_6]